MDPDRVHPRHFGCLLQQESCLFFPAHLKRVNRSSLADDISTAVKLEEMHFPCNAGNRREEAEGIRECICVQSGKAISKLQAYQE